MQPTQLLTEATIFTTTTLTSSTSTQSTWVGGKDCTAEVQQALLVPDCSDCSPQVAIDGDSGTAVLTSSAKEVKLMSLIDGIFRDILDPIDIGSAGRSPAISGDSIAVGIPERFILYEKNLFTETWLQSTTRLKPETQEFLNEERFGNSVAIDGEIMVVGAPGINVNTGSAYVYQRTQTGSSSEYAWSQVRKIRKPGGYVLDFGEEVAVKGDLIAIGDPKFGQNGAEWIQHGSKSERGAVFVYSSYESEAYTSRIQNTECKRWFGSKVVFTDEGDLLVSCPDPGAVYYYTQSDDDEKGVFNPPQKIRPSEEEPDDGFGQSIAVDGNVMAVGTNKESFGKVYLFTLSDDDTWIELSAIDSPMGSKHFGKSVALSGNTLVVSSSNNAYSYSLSDCGI